MDFRFSDKEEALRMEVREFLARELTPEEQGAGFSREFALKLGAKGWLAITWPEEYGGLGASPMDCLILTEELVYHRAPMGVQIIGMGWVGTSLMRYGTEEQKGTYLPDIGRGKTWVCTAYSEPGAGSDMASLQCRARLDGDSYIIDGQKTFITGAHLCDYVWLAARTNSDVPKHKGISAFLVDLKMPGITIRPLVNMVGMHHFNEVFFDGVRVYRDCLIGEENQGWYMLVTALDEERSMIASPTGCRRILDDLVGFAKEARGKGEPLARDPVVRHRLAEIATEIEVGRMLAYRVAWMQARGIIPNYEVSIAKVFNSELEQRVANVGMQVLGLYGQLQRDSKWTSLEGRIGPTYLNAVSATIFGGTSEIQRIIVAIRGLGLPRQ